MPKVDIEAAPRVDGARYPPPFDAPCDARSSRRLSALAGLARLGLNVLTLPPGQWSSQRHWHAEEDEFVWVLEGEVVLVDDAGETPLGPGDCAAFKAGDPNGHHLQNRSASPARLLQASSKAAPGTEAVVYPDIDLAIPRGAADYAHRDGRPYGKADPRG